MPGGRRKCSLYKEEDGLYIQGRGADLVRHMWPGW